MLAFRAAMVWAKTYWNSVLPRFVFELLNLGNSKVHFKDIAEEMLRVGMKSCPVSVQRLHRHLATLFISLLATLGEEGKCNNVKI